MKVSKCSLVGPVVINSTLYSLRALHNDAPEGVYRSIKWPKARYLAVGTGEVRTVICLSDGFLTGVNNGLSGSQFIQIEGAEVCFEIKEPQ